jgi:SAM-dependent methyltransferase
VRIHTHDQLLDLLDEIVAGSARGDRTRTEAAEFWAELLTRDGHPLATDRPDENLVDWHARGLLGNLTGARVLDIGCGNGRNSRWFAEQHARVQGIDISAPLLDLIRDRMPPAVELRPADILRDSLPDGQFDVVYDSGCFHHISPHRRATYLDRVLPLIAPGGVFGIVTFASEVEALTSDAVVITSGDNGGGSSFTVTELEEIFSVLQPVEARRVRADVDDTFGAGFLNAALFRSRA